MALLYKRIGIDLIATAGQDIRVKVSLNDSVSGFLNDKLTVSTSNKLTKNITTPGGNETLQLDVDETNIDHNILLNYDIDEHRRLDDALTTTTNLWSADKIQTELDGKINSVPNPVADNKLVKTIGLNGVDLEQTGIDVDDSNNITGVNDLTVDGDLTVNGTEFIANVETIDVEDPNIGLNRNGTQATANAQKAGFTVQMTDATNAIVGYDSTTTSKFKLGEDGDEREVVTTTHTQSMSNKTIDGDLNTISNLRHGEEVDDPSLDVHGVGVGNSVVGTGTTQTLENKTIDGTSATGNNDISLDAQDAVYDNSTSGLTATDAQAAIDELDGRIDNIEGSYVESFNSRTGIVVPLASDYDADQVDFDPSSSYLTATDVQAAIDENAGTVNTHVNASSGVHGVTGSVVGTTDAQVLQQKTIDGTSATGNNNVTIDADDATYDNSSSGLAATDVQAAIDELAVSGGNSFRLNQAAHGFSVLDAVYTDGATWQLAQADDSETLATHLVIEVEDVNNVILAQAGRFEITGHGLTLGEYYYTSESVAGQITATEPSTFSNPIVLVDTVNTIIVLPFRPSFIDNTVVSQQIIDLINGATSQPVTNFLINPVGFRSFQAQVNVEVDSDTNFDEANYITGLWNGTEWVLNIESIGESNVSFDMLNSGQLIYTAPTYSGFNAGKISFKYNINIRGI